MAVYLSPGVYINEIDLSSYPASVGGSRPAFIGTAIKGPMNVPVLLSSASQAIEVFGDPDPTSYMMYAILDFFAEGTDCYGMRVGISSEDDQAEALADVAVDQTGARVAGWGRIPVFSGIDYGRLTLRAVTAAKPLVFHAASISGTVFNDDDLGTDETEATLDFGSGFAYTGDTDETYVLTITGDPDTTSDGALSGATFQVVRSSTGEVVVDDVLSDQGDPNTSAWINAEDGLRFRIVVTAGALAAGDSFTFQVVADNRTFSVAIEGDTPDDLVIAAGTYTTVADFVDAFNDAAVSQDYLAVSNTVSGVVVPQIRTTARGRRIQLTGTAAFATTVGVSRYVYDIPRSYLIGQDAGPYSITSSNNRVVLDLIGDDETSRVIATLSTGASVTATTVANTLNAAGIVSSERVWNAFVLTTPGGIEKVVLSTTTDNMYSTIRLLADYSNIKTLNFATELGIVYPYSRTYRGFSDTRVALPTSSSGDPAVAYTCSLDSGSDECASDTAYFENIVGWIVATSPGTWVDDYAVTLSLFTEGVGETAGRYKITVTGPGGIVADMIEDVSFDKNSTRYIEKLINPGSQFGGLNGNKFVNWEPRPAYLENDPSADDYVVRQPSQLFSTAFEGGKNGIPLDPAYSSDLDSAVIGNPALSSGLYGFQNPDTIDITLLCTPGFSSGAVIGQALQLCASRGDVLYLVDPPFGLRPQQVVDWHNGMLLSDLSSAINSSYGALYYSWVEILDQFNKIRVWVPPSGQACAVYSRSARVGEPWTPPAGTRRALLPTVLNLEYSPSQGERNLLYGSGNAVNPLVKFPQEGVTIFGQRTLQRASTALDRVNVRLLLIYLKKTGARLLRQFVHELNDSILWSQIRNTLNPFMGDVASRRGITGYRVVCDESNNTPERVARHELWISIFFIPEESAEFVVLNLAIMQQSASFTAEEILAAGGVVSR